jgi:hypothetical protein
MSEAARIWSRESAPGPVLGSSAQQRFPRPAYCAQDHLPVRSPGCGGSAPRAANGRDIPVAADPRTVRCGTGARDSHKEVLTCGGVTPRRGGHCVVRCPGPSRPDRRHARKRDTPLGRDNHATSEPLRQRQGPVPSQPPCPCAGGRPSAATLLLAWCTTRRGGAEAPQRWQG